MKKPFRGAIFALQEIFSAEEIEESGLLPKVLEVQEAKAKSLEAAAEETPYIGGLNFPQWIGLSGLDD